MVEVDKFNFDGNLRTLGRRYRFVLAQNQKHMAQTSIDTLAASPNRTGTIALFQMITRESMNDLFTQFRQLYHAFCTHAATLLK
jgi:tRNA U54 and U55 pseudouridine synthase Pus10